MEKKKMKLWKKILIIVLLVFIVFVIHIIRNFVIISKLSNISAEYANKTNYIADVYSIQGNSINIAKAYNKDDKYLSSLEVKLNYTDEIRRLTIYRTEDDALGIIQSGETKIAILNDNVLGGVQLSTFQMFGHESAMNIFQKILFSAMTWITTEECRDKDCYYIEIQDEWKMWVDKDNGTILREINGSIITERTYEFGTVKDEDITKPDISDCQIQE